MRVARARGLEAWGVLLQPCGRRGAVKRPATETAARCEWARARRGQDGRVARRADAESRAGVLDQDSARWAPRRLLRVAARNVDSGGGSEDVGQPAWGGVKDVLRVRWGCVARARWWRCGVAVWRRGVAGAAAWRAHAA